MLGYPNGKYRLWPSLAIPQLGLNRRSTLTGYGKYINWGTFNDWKSGTDVQAVYAALNDPELSDWWIAQLCRYNDLDKEFWCNHCMEFLLEDCMARLQGEATINNDTVALARRIKAIDQAGYLEDYHPNFYDVGDAGQDITLAIDIAVVGKEEGGLEGAVRLEATLEAAENGRIPGWYLDFPDWATYPDNIQAWRFWAWKQNNPA